MDNRYNYNSLTSCIASTPQSAGIPTYTKAIYDNNLAPIIHIALSDSRSSANPIPVTTVWASPSVNVLVLSKRSQTLLVCAKI